MHQEPIDIIVPVWNRPIETRACLVSLIENSSNIRLILVDNSCDRETEGMLGEFAEALDVRALFLKNRLNEGFVKGVNRGLSRAESEFVAIVRQNSTVRPGWLEKLCDTMNEAPDVGIVVPEYFDKVAKKSLRQRGSVFRGMEVSYIDFAGFLMRRSLLDTVGNFNEEMDGGFWCLKEYGRMAWRGGFRTCVAPECLVERSEEPGMGSTARRAELDLTLRTQFRESWGEEQAFCIHLAKGADLSSMNERRTLIATAARQGNRILLVVHPSIVSELVRSGFNRIHEHISVIPLSRVMPERSARKMVSDFSAHGIPLECVCWQDGVHFPGGSASISFAAFESIVRGNERTYYGRTTEV